MYRCRYRLAGILPYLILISEFLNRCETSPECPARGNTYSFHMANLWDTALNLLGTGVQYYSLRKSLQQERELHEHEHAHSAEQHFSSASLEMLAIAKEADRDVWEQRNNQFNQMLVCATLMFGVAVGNVNEGTYAFDKATDKAGAQISSLLSPDGIFVFLSAFGIASLFVCIVACLLVMRRMSSYMIGRSSNLVDRLSASMNLAHQISGAAQHPSASAMKGMHCNGGEAAHWASVNASVNEAKRKLHDRLGGAIVGSGSRGALSHPLDVDANALHRGSQQAPNGSDHVYSHSDYVGFVDRPGHQKGSYVPPTPSAPPAPANRKGLASATPSRKDAPAPAGCTPRLLPNSSQQRVVNGRQWPPPINTHVASFGRFYQEHCVQLSMTVNGSFVVGTICTWFAVWFLLWNQARALCDQTSCKFHRTYRARRASTRRASTRRASARRATPPPLTAPSARCASQFPHLFMSLAAFALVGLIALVVSGALEHTTRRRDQVIGDLLRSAGLCAPVAPPMPGSPELQSPATTRTRRLPTTEDVMMPMAHLPSPPASPPPVTAPAAPRRCDAACDAPRLTQTLRVGEGLPPRPCIATRLRELAALQEEGLLLPHEYSAKREQILAAL